ncbi:Solute carrier family 25 member 45 [Penicillium subrubescens]|uniref:Solute carrier family 25 member 45 n=3 Tax=Penicillium subrubescens TaxID=1316194 RepID=A0A1Q5UFH9_9EURO|nr:Solute carrier family 25 member 45 [Penicillium subrubescens]
MKILLCGGIAGIVTWGSIFPLDMVKTRLQAQTIHEHSLAQTAPENQNLLRQPRATLNSYQMAQEVYRAEGMGAFYRGLGICSIRAFIVNAVQWACYEWLMKSFNNASVHVPVTDRI